MTRPLNTILFGGCLIHWPLMRTQCADGRLALDGYGPIKEIHTFGEIFQIIAVLRGEKDVPQEYRYLAHMLPGLKPVRGADNFAGLDLALVEPASPIELEFRGFAVNRFAISRYVVAQLDEEDKEANKLCSTWLRSGLVGLNEKIRVEAGEKLVGHVRGDGGKAELARAVIRETSAAPSDLDDGFRKLQGMLACPIGVVLYVFRYMPDGRAISWPAGFRERVLMAAQDLGLPTFDPVPLVTNYGVEEAMKPGLSHYKTKFFPVVARGLIEFAQGVREKSAHPARPAGHENADEEVVRQL
jgi:hypothetical protein